MSRTLVIIMICSLLAHLLIVLNYKVIVKTKVFLTIAALSIIIGLTGYFLNSIPDLTYTNINGVVFFYLPIISLLFVGFFRFLILEIYGDEPIMTKWLALSWEQGHKRRLHMGDVIFTLSILTGPLIVFGIINNLLNN